MFLKDQMGSKETICNLTVDDGASDSICSGPQDPEKGSATPKRPGKKTPKKLTAEESLIKAAEQIVEKIPSVPATLSSPKRLKLSDNKHFGQTVARQLMRLEEGEEKENLKLEIQVMIYNSQYGSRPSSRNVPFQRHFQGNY